MGNRFPGGILPGAIPFLHKYIGNPILASWVACFSESLFRIFAAACGDSRQVYPAFGFANDRDGICESDGRSGFYGSA